MTTQKIQRLSDDKEELEWINWSPNGRWILHGRRLLYDQMSEYTISAVAVQNLTVRDLGSQFISYWLNANEILQYRMGIETYQLLVVNIDTGNMTEVWEGYFWGHNVDPTGNWIVLNSISSTIPPDEEKPGFAPGIQLINMKSLETIQEPEPLLDPPDLFVRANDGTVVDLPNTIEMIVASPNTKYWAVAIKKDLKIYTQDLTLVVAIPLPFQDTQFDDIPWRPDDIQWSPDSSGLFLMYGKNVYKVNVSERDINLIETNLISSTKWINDQ